ncbi:MAG: ABC transporter ATP-binding protein/permease [Clostridiales bacterium]|jgi:ATP-binding cassette subfamily B protein|nr:ABC transporter ATP-binding protein/permease [Clostridiales bacterium]
MKQSKFFPKYGPGMGGGRGFGSSVNRTRGNTSGSNIPAKLEINWSSAKRLLLYLLGKHKVKLAIVFACIIISSLANVASATFIETLIDEHIVPLLGEPNPVFTGLLRVIGQMAVLYIVCIGASLAYNRLMVTVAQEVQKRIRDNMFEHMQKLPIKYFDTNPFGDIMSHYTNDIDTLRQLLSQTIPQTMSTVLTLAAITVAMFSINLYMTLIVFLCVGIMMLVIRKIGGNSAKHFIQVQKSLGDVNAFIEERINGQKVIKVFNHEDITKQEFDKKNDELYEQAKQANKFAIILMPIMGNIGNLQYVLIALAGGVMAVFGLGGVTLGAIAAFLTLSRSFAGPIGQLSMQMNAVIMALAGAARIFNLLDTETENDDGYVTLVNAKREKGNLVECETPTGIWAWRHPHGDGKLTYAEVKGDVRLANVDFEYVEGKPVLTDLSVFAKPGEKIAFVGATGAGKTTVTNLINRFYDIAEGKIRFDGINITKIKKSDLRRAIGIVLQDVNLFTGTVMDNIRYGKLTATDEEVIRAAKLANAHDFITRLPEKYETVIESDGGALSQGQRQLLSIARAAVADPPVMILDEATSSIDTRTEAIVQKGMDSLMEGRTVFVIAHRLSTIKNAKAIMVMDAGRVIERGDHETLLAQKGKYYQLYTGSVS